MNYWFSVLWLILSYSLSEQSVPPFKWAEPPFRMGFFFNYCIFLICVYKFFQSHSFFSSARKITAKFLIAATFFQFFLIFRLLRISVQDKTCFLLLSGKNTPNSDVVCWGCVKINWVRCRAEILQIYSNLTNWFSDDYFCMICDDLQDFSPFRRLNKFWHTLLWAVRLSA